LNLIDNILFIVSPEIRNAIDLELLMLISNLEKQSMEQIITSFPPPLNTISKNKSIIFDSLNVLDDNSITQKKLDYIYLPK
jgi:hypothetical protein